MRPSSPWSLHECLSIGTVLQNTTVARTVQMARALAGLLSTWYRFPDDVVFETVFWHRATGNGPAWPDDLSHR